MKKISVWAAVAVMACFFSTLSNAQGWSPLPKWEVGLSGGPFVYQGDLAPSMTGSFKMADPGVAVSASRLLNRFLELRTSLTIAGLRGDDRKYDGDAWRQARALRFHTSVAEISESVVYDIFGRPEKADQVSFTPYVMAGIGYAFLGVHRDASRFDSAYFGAQSAITNGLKLDTAKRTPRGVMVMPIGVGVRYTVTPALGLSLEAVYRFSETDYLDGFSKVGNDGRNDHYYGIMLGVRYTFWPGVGLKCPKMDSN